MNARGRAWPDRGWEKYTHRKCYQFNKALRLTFDDGDCSHCKDYLTTQCKHLDEFMDAL